MEHDSVEELQNYKLIKIKVLNGQKEEPCNEVPNEASTNSVCHQTTEPSHQEGPPESSEANTVCPETVHAPHQEAVAEPSELLAQKMPVLSTPKRHPSISTNSSDSSRPITPFAITPESSRSVTPVSIVGEGSRPATPSTEQVKITR